MFHGRTVSRLSTIDPLTSCIAPPPFPKSAWCWRICNNVCLSIPILREKNTTLRFLRSINQLHLDIPRIYYTILYFHKAFRIFLHLAINYSQILGGLSNWSYYKFHRGDRIVAFDVGSNAGNAVNRWPIHRQWRTQRPRSFLILHCTAHESRR